MRTIRLTNLILGLLVFQLISVKAQTADQHFTFQWIAVEWPDGFQHITAQTVSYANGPTNITFLGEDDNWREGYPQKKHLLVGFEPTDTIPSGEDPIQLFLALANQENQVAANLLVDFTSPNGNEGHEVAFELFDIDLDNTVQITGIDPNGNAVYPLLSVDPNATSVQQGALPGLVEGNGIDAGATYQGRVGVIFPTPINVMSIITDLGTNASKGDEVFLSDITTKYLMLPQPKLVTDLMTIDWQAISYPPGVLAKSFSIADGPSGQPFQWEIASQLQPSNSWQGNYPDDLNTFGNMQGYGDSESLVLQAAANAKIHGMSRLRFSEALYHLHFSLADIDNSMITFPNGSVHGSVDHVQVYGLFEGEKVIPYLASHQAGASFYFINENEVRAQSEFKDQVELLNIGSGPGHGTLNVYFQDPVDEVHILYSDLLGQAIYPASTLSLGIGDLHFQDFEPENRSRQRSKFSTNSVGSLQIYPNPVRSHVTFDSSILIRGDQLSLFDLDGLRLMHWTFEPNQAIDLSHLPAGTYSVVGSSAGEVQLRLKLVKT